MRIGIQTWGTEGDVRPFFALARSLQLRGHQVRVHYTSVEGRTFEDLARGCGVEGRSIGEDYFVTHRDQVAQAMEALFSQSPIKQIRKILEASMDPVVDRMFDAACELAEESDLVIGHFMTHPAGAAAEKYGRPYVLVSLQPVLPSVHYAPIGMPNLGRWMNPLLWKILASVLESILRDRVNHVRERAGLSTLRGLMKATMERTLLALTAVSPTLFERPIDWDPRIQVSGFLNIAEVAEPWTPDPSLERFLEGPTPPWFMSFGSMFNLSDTSTREAIDATLEATSSTGTRCVIQAPEPVVRTMENSGDHHFITRAPHGQLFPRCSGIIHHGGAGTTQSAMLAGRPSIIVPHAADQFFWGDRLHQQGLAAKPIARHSLTARKLASRIREVLEDESKARRAIETAATIRTENGPERAADLIEEAWRTRS